MLNTLFYIHGQVVFDILGNLPSKNTMTIANCKKVGSPILAQMRHHQILVLIYFIRILRAETRFSRKWKLGHTVVKLFLSSRNFSCNARISFYLVVVIGLIKLNLSLTYIDNFWQVTLSWLLCRRRIILLHLLIYRHRLGSFHLHTSVRSYLLYVDNRLGLSLVHFLGAQRSYLIMSNLFWIVAFSKLLSQIITSDLRLLYCWP